MFRAQQGRALVFSLITAAFLSPMGVGPSLSGMNAIQLCCARFCDDRCMSLTWYDDVLGDDTSLKFFQPSAAQAGRKVGGYAAARGQLFAQETSRPRASLEQGRMAMRKLYARAVPEIAPVQRGDGEHYQDNDARVGQFNGEEANGEVFYRISPNRLDVSSEAMRPLCSSDRHASMLALQLGTWHGNTARVKNMGMVREA
ncbi:hypothetical protein PG994_002210 [Apiospora phragmitis]|uniref:Uncharacterized protein n=1 Tax=Apiospora phragmitis TaxID=2905665 RepID=A0ABR1WVQ2_9PEZI